MPYPEKDSITTLQPMSKVRSSRCSDAAVAMDNGERGRRLMAMAAEYLQDMDAATGRESWNVVVRRAQEVVKLALKGVLSYLGVDFPKVHDPAAVFIATLPARGMALSAAEAEHVTNVSAALARKRAPSGTIELP